VTVTIRPQHPDDRPVVRALVTAAFDRAVIADLAETLQARGAHAYVAEVDGQVVGHVALSRSWLDAPARLVEVLVLSPLSVLPSLQGRGIGGALVRHALAEAERLAAPALFLEGAPGYYGRFGFAPARPLGFTPPSVRIPDAAFQVVLLPAYEPWMIGALVYAEAFWAFDCVGLR
jgi:putative acetyltransferase